MQHDPYAAYGGQFVEAQGVHGLYASHNPDAFTLLDEAEARAALRISRSTLQRLVRRGKLKRSAVSTGRALFPLSEIQRLIQTPLEPNPRAA